MDDAVVGRMKEVEAAIKKLDPSVRAAAFSMMKDYILEGSPLGAGAATKATSNDSTETASKAKVAAPTTFHAYIDKFESNVPAETALALVGWLYGEYGIEPFSMQEVKELAESAGVTIPARPDMTIRQKNWNKKKAFRKTGRSFFRPTVDGEAFLKDTFGVKKGTKKRPKAES